MIPRRLTRFFALFGVSCGLLACATGPEIDDVIHKSPQGSVSLERFDDRTFQAAHPLHVAPQTIERVLRGLLVKPTQRVLQTLIAGEADATRLLTDEDVRFLAPLLVEGLARAAHDQQIGFRIVQGHTEETDKLTPVGDIIAGSLYVYGRSLYVNLRVLRLQKNQGGYEPDRPNRGVRDTTGLSSHLLTFSPASALRPDSYRDARSTKATVIIDYELLASSRENANKPLSTGTTPNTVAEPKKPAKAPSTRDAEVEALRQELREIKKQLADQEAERSGRIPPAPLPR